ncbi:cytochrome c peroxidase [Dyadobacter jejuensis]|uniref:Cytochrome c peroxidase n=1 Tax=Dyadobacter jejuensis TaxID=1082580 RepID=A0A316AKM2_9BACT|nr:cytochrome c peroxidase [Dyadobacter jejuensis]PWJ57420.1 cytochrome c peroxidase [Dyadobacter jejuensis]
MSFYQKLLLLLIPAYLLISFQRPQSFQWKEPIATTQTLLFFKSEAKIFATRTDLLLTALNNLTADSSSVHEAKQQLAACRLAYKRIAFFTNYFFPSETRMYNAAPVTEVEEPTLEYVEPMGLQQIESLLFENDAYAYKAELVQVARVLHAAVADLPALLYQFELTDAQILESIRLEWLRIMSLYVSGYDAPLLKTGIAEAFQATKAFREVLHPYLQDDRGAEIDRLLMASEMYFKNHQDFDRFDRLQFYTDYAIPFQKALDAFARTRGLYTNSSIFLNENTPNIFAKDALLFEKQNTPNEKGSVLIQLGERLFMDPALSADGRVSCSTCHIPSLYFQDGLARSKSMNPHEKLKRHTPTLLYSANQRIQFWEGRAGSLDQQALDVLFNPLEMGADSLKLLAYLRTLPAYQSGFTQAYGAGQAVSMTQVTNALTAYVSTLAPFSSDFDRYIAGDPTALDEGQKAGFNLFMGKAQCGTCHFIPYFNGLLPPLFDISEIEILGTPLNEDLEHPSVDPDEGRYDLYRVPYYKGAFKTPTVRNVAQTAPYMHNGAFSSLEKVVDFYNEGGGVGIGLDIPHQTLSPLPLELTNTEIQNLVAFMESLTDNPKTFTHNY